MSEHLLVRAARGEPVERVPVWAMRQAGRWDPEFRRIRDGLDFYSFSQDVERSVAASLCPRRFGVDAIILFYDITSLPIAMGLPFDLVTGKGPVPRKPVRSFADVELLDAEPPPESYGHIRKILARVKQELQGALPVIVFAGAPFTVASYCIGTGKDIHATSAFAKEQPGVWDGLREKLRVATIGFLKTLIADGADIYQLFDSWAGLLMPPHEHVWASSEHAAIFHEATGVPRFLFVKESQWVKSMTVSGADVVSLGTRHNLREHQELHPKIVFQGNVDQAILEYGTPEQVRDAVRKCLQAGGGRRHILNLNHGVGKNTPVENFTAYIEAAKS